MTEHKERKTNMTSNDNDQSAREPTLSGAPNRELELKVKKEPRNDDAKADLGSDESMDASDPSSATQPSAKGPVPSSGFPEDKSKA
ncbi:hypothetical protein [Sphingomonas sp. LY160]|uniref:hypothetical protein n=1 Tax=Sphingomonas sp. LY160 TaxID=3095342 RepID=UPI002ADEA666|nr:hypothetical protein [Sphingomonas sp. LY160]MEA1071707.1 hypothetical protein [Sphingomonas sp. LY160]